MPFNYDVKYKINCLRINYLFLLHPLWKIYFYMCKRMKLFQLNDSYGDLSCNVVGDVEFFIKKHCFVWLPSNLVTTAAAWRLYQEINLGGSLREQAIAKLSNLNNLMGNWRLKHFTSENYKYSLSNFE